MTNNKIIQPLEKRFWNKVDKRGRKKCWPWTGHIMKNGYGQIQRGKRGEGVILAHRLSWEIHIGDIPNNLYVLHLCDNPRCVNPSHLVLGTQRANLMDMSFKGRGSGKSMPGEQHPNAKLNDETVMKIRKLASKGMTHRKIAYKFGVSKTTITNVVNNRTWRHIT